MAFRTMFTEQHLLNPGQHQGCYLETLCRGAFTDPGAALPREAFLFSFCATGT